MKRCETDRSRGIVLEADPGVVKARRDKQGMGRQKEFTSLADLTPDHANARKHNPRNVGMLVDSLHQVGAARSIVVDENGVVLAGNATIEAAAEAGIHRVKTVEADGSEIVAVVRRGLSEEQKTKLALYDNRVAELAEWNPEILAELVDTKALEGMFSDKELAEILTQTGIESKEPEDAEADPDTAEELNRKWQVSSGDLFEMGPHRLLCGDSTSTQDVKRLMGDTLADLCFTSPPYSKQRQYGGTSGDWDTLMSGVFLNAPLNPSAQLLVNLGLIHEDGEWLPYWDGWIDAMRSAGWKRFGWYVWDQNHGLPGDWNGRLAPSHEFVFHFTRKPQQPNKTVATKPNCAAKAEAKRRGAARGKVQQGLRSADGVISPLTSLDKAGQAFKIPDSVIRIVREQSRGIHTEGHPAVFPVALPAFFIETFSKRGQVVYEPFSGSGTQLVAAENAERSCFAMEITPKYCALALERLSRAFPHLKIEKVDQARAVA